MGDMDDVDHFQCALVDATSRFTKQRAETTVQVALALTFYGSLSSVLGAILVISRPAPKPWLYGILKGFLAGALAMSVAADQTDTGYAEFSWPYIVGGGPVMLALVFIPVGALDAEIAAGDAAAAEIMQREEEGIIDSPVVRERPLGGGILTAVLVGLRNLVYGVYVFPWANSGEWRFKFPGIMYSLGARYITLGVAVAVPIYFTAGSKAKTLQAVAVSSLATRLAP